MSIRVTCSKGSGENSSSCRGSRLHREPCYNGGKIDPPHRISDDTLDNRSSPGGKRVHERA